jgi:hypothetical protein
MMDGCTDRFRISPLTAPEPRGLGGTARMIRIAGYTFLEPNPAWNDIKTLTL